MRILPAILALTIAFGSKAQTNLPVNQLDFMQWRPTPASFVRDSSAKGGHKWQLSKYGGLSAGYLFYGGGGTSFLSAPLGLQLTRPLTNNIYAFAGVSAAPVLFSVNRLYTDPVTSPGFHAYNPSGPYKLGYSSRVEMGLMYINDAHTFSISGSVGVERGNYYTYPVYRNNNSKRQ
ncbi:MAG TPA: hypothetical protein VN824_17465 [Puia sp.]|nr:hypothetical protein [Puia sp.]